MSAKDLICFELPQWLSLAASNSEPAQTARAVSEATNVAQTITPESSGPSSLFGLLTTFMLGWQASSYGLAEGFTRLAEAMKGRGRTWGDLATILWGIGVFFGKLGFGRPSLEKRKEREKIERLAKKKVVQKANVDRPIDQTDIGRYVRYKFGNEQGIALMVSFDHPKKLVMVKRIMDDMKFAVDMRTVSFTSDEENK